LSSWVLKLIPNSKHNQTKKLHSLLHKFLIKLFSLSISFQAWQDLSIGVHYLLTKLGLSWISARSKHPKQDKEAQALYKKLQTKGNRCLTCGHRLK
jgi:uncharacterized membrane protein